MIRSADNDKLKTIRKLQDRRWRDKLDLFVAEGEDLVEAAWEPEFVLVAGEDVEPELLDDVSTLGSGTRVIGVYKRRWSEPGGDLSVYLHGVGDPGNVGTIIRSGARAERRPGGPRPGLCRPLLAKGRAGEHGLDLRAGRPRVASRHGRLVGLDAHAERTLGEVAPEPPLTLCLGAERTGLPEELTSERARIPLRDGGPESLNVAMAATVALYDVAHRMAAHA